MGLPKTMEVVIMVRRLYIFFVLFIAGSSLLAKVKSITSQKGFDQIVSAVNPLSVIFIYREPRKNLERETRKAIRYARKGFKNVSYLDAYEIAGIKFGQVNLEKMPELQEEFDLEKDEKGNNSPHSEQGYIILFKRTRAIHVSRPFVLHQDGSENLIYNSTKNLIDAYMGDDINELIQEHVEHQRELEKARAEAAVYIDPYYLYDPFNYYYNGYNAPRWRQHHYQRPGFGIHFGF